ncbi:uncharacterized protein LOC104877623 isoform X3 [Vitis vinifera]|nr:uncharacterized protein LOC104877623 isoform X3 [Vitis vinifera]|eukprot:XP_019072620.1 PREDICTED: uncharacterized protein LOC104877623 isoform X3 [Vitis vinifera]
MVRRKSCFYHLPESVPIKHAFQGLKGTWFLHTEASSLGGSDLSSLSNHVTVETRNHTYDGSNVTDPMEPKSYTAIAVRDKNKSKGRRRRIKRYHCLKAVLWGLLRTVYFSRKSRRKRVKKNRSLACTVSGIENGCPGRSKKISGPSAKERSGFCTSGNEEEHRKEWISKVVECPSERSSEVVSVSGIIERYFSNFDGMNHFGSPSSSEVNSRVISSWSNEQLRVTTDGNHSDIQIGTTPLLTTKTPARETPFSLSTNSRPGTSRDKLEITEVGKRLVMASNTLGISSSKQRPAISISRFKDGKLLGLDSSLVRSMVFEMSDDDD